MLWIEILGRPGRRRPSTKTARVLLRSIQVAILDHRTQDQPPRWLAKQTACLCPGQ